MTTTTKPNAAVAMQTAEKEEIVRSTLAEFTADLDKNIADCAVKKGCIRDLEGPGVFEALADEDGVSLRELGNSVQWELKGRDAALRIAALRIRDDGNEDSQPAWDFIAAMDLKPAMQTAPRKYIRRRGVGRIKYWTACVSTRAENGQRDSVLCSGGCYSSLKEAVAAMPRLNSSRAAVVKAGRDGMPTSEIVRHI